jgi:hypothetical protein
MTGPRATKLALLLAGTLLLAGCSHTQAVRSGGTIEIQLSEYRLTPQSVRAQAGFFTIVVHNRGVLDHNLVVYHDGTAINSVSPIGPGQTTQMSLLLTPGTYSMVSTVLSDQSLGAYGTLRVVK